MIAFPYLFHFLSICLAVRLGRVFGCLVQCMHSFIAFYYLFLSLLFVVLVGYYLGLLIVLLCGVGLSAFAYTFLTTNHCLLLLSIS